ncbi:MAG: peptidylprolyl isomerase [Desulfuromonadales bacterium]|nr:peptidylprolyl isomerase [Desulfuromonadales bacterium]
MNKRIFITIAVALVSCLTFAGCNSKTPEGGEKSASETKNASAVLAEVNGTNITVEDFQKEVNNLPPYLKPMTDTPDGKRELLDTMIIRELIMQDAKKMGIENTPEVKAQLEDARRRIIVQAYIKTRVEKEATISDEELKKFYDANKDKFKTGAQIHASHILVQTEQQAQDILAQLKNGASFEDLAKKYSIDGSAQKGGDLGWFGKGAMVPAFEKVAFGLKVGAISNIVKTQFGYHIIKVTGERPAGIRTFDEVKDQIRAILLPAKQQEVFQKIKDDLKKNGKFTINEDVFKSIGGGPAPAAGQNAPAAPAAPSAPVPPIPGSQGGAK